MVPRVAPIAVGVMVFLVVEAAPQPL